MSTNHDTGIPSEDRKEELVTDSVAAELKTNGAEGAPTTDAVGEAEEPSTDGAGEVQADDATGEVDEPSTDGACELPTTDATGEAEELSTDGAGEVQADDATGEANEPSTDSAGEVPTTDVAGEAGEGADGGASNQDDLLGVDNNTPAQPKPVGAKTGLKRVGSFFTSMDKEAENKLVGALTWIEDQFMTGFIYQVATSMVFALVALLATFALVPAILGYAIFSFGGFFGWLCLGIWLFVFQPLWIGRLTRITGGIFGQDPTDLGGELTGKAQHSMLRSMLSHFARTFKPSTDEHLYRLPHTEFGQLKAAIKRWWQRGLIQHREILVVLPIICVLAVVLNFPVCAGFYISGLEHQVVQTIDGVESVTNMSRSNFWILLGFLVNLLWIRAIVGVFEKVTGNKLA